MNWRKWFGLESEDAVYVGQMELSHSASSFADEIANNIRAALVNAATNRVRDEGQTIVLASDIDVVADDVLLNYVADRKSADNAW